RACALARLLFTAPASAEIYTLSLHDALPICRLEVVGQRRQGVGLVPGRVAGLHQVARRRIDGHRRIEDDARLLLGLQIGVPLRRDRKSTRLNSSHVKISYAVFCLKKKKTHRT